MQNKFIEVKNVTFKYDESVEKQNAVNNINLNIEKGSVPVLLGHNG